MDVSIIVNHYRAPVALKLCLRELREQVKIPHEIIVVDSGALKETGQMLKEYFPEVQYIPFTENVGFARSVNAGIAQAKAQHLFISNADILVRPGTVEMLCEYLREHPDVAMAGPRLRNIDGTLQSSAFRYYTPLRILARRTPFGKTPWGRKVLAVFSMQDVISEKTIEPVTADWLMGSAMCVRKEAIDKVGMLDDRFFMYFEDVDWSRRFWEAGYKVMYMPAAECYHFHARASRGGLLDIFRNPYTRLHLRSAAKYFRKHGFITPHHGA